MNFYIAGREISIRKEVAAAVVVVLVVAIAALYYIINRDDEQLTISNDNGNKALDTVNTVANQAKEHTVPEDQNGTKDSEEIQVYVIGCVKKAGIVTLKKGQLIYDAIMAAGGPTKDADLRFNLAYKLTGNVMLEVPSKKPEKTGSKTEKKSSQSNAASTPGPKPRIVKDPGGVIVKGTSAQKNVSSSGSSGGSGKINLNTATLAELDTLPRVGEKTAKEIIAYRKKNGGFKKIEEIMEVSRIGQKTFDNMKDMITVE